MGWLVGLPRCLYVLGLLGSRWWVGWVVNVLFELVYGSMGNKRVSD